MGVTRSIFRHTAIYSAATILGKMASFFMLPFYAHIFQAEGYGVIAMIETSLGVLTILLAGGFQTAILRIYHEQTPELKPVALGTGMRLVWGLGMGLVALPLLFSAPLSNLILGSQAYAPLICLALLSFVIDVAGQSASTFLVIKERSVLYSFIGLLRLFLGLGLNIWLIVILQVGLIGVFISSLITAIVASLVFHVVAVRDHGFGFHRAIAVQMLRFQLPLLPGDIVAFIGRQAERILVRVLISLEGMGILEMAYKFPPLMNLFIAIPFQRAWRTKSIEIAEEPTAPVVMGMMLTRFLFLMVFFGLLLAVAIPQLLMLLTPPEFWSAARISRVEIMTTILTGCHSFMAFGILYRKKTKLLSYMKVTLTPFKIVLAFVLISTWGLAGAAYSALVIEGAVLVWISVLSQRLYPVVIEYRKLILTLVAAAGLFLLLDGNSYTNFPPAVFARTELLPAVLDYLQTTALGSWKSGKLIQLLQAREEPFIAMVINLFFCLSFLVLLPLVIQRDPEAVVAASPAG